MNDSEQFPRQSYEDIKTNGPDERAYKSMEVVAAAGGVEAEGRRNEMAKWSEASGRLVESAQRSHVSAEEEIASRGWNAEVSKQQIAKVNGHIAENGITTFGSDSRDGISSQNIKAVNNGGVMVKEHGSRDILRSPAHISEPIPSALSVADTKKEEAGKLRSA